MTTQLSPQPLDTFIESVASARYEEARLWPGATVESAGAFEQMQAYVLDLYRPVGPVESFVETDGQVIDCIREDMHPAARRWDGLAIAPAESPPQVPESHEPAPPDPRSRETVSPPPHSLVTARAFPTDTTPLYRTTLSRLCRFPNMAAVSAKDKPAGLASLAPAEAPVASSGKRYATGEQDIDCLGGSSIVNVWGPFVAPTFQSTFSQQWYLAGQDGHPGQIRRRGRKQHLPMARDGFRAARFGGFRPSGVPTGGSDQSGQRRWRYRDPRVGRLS